MYIYTYIYIYCDISVVVAHQDALGVFLDPYY